MRLNSDPVLQLPVIWPKPNPALVDAYGKLPPDGQRIVLLALRQEMHEISERIVALRFILAEREAAEC